MPASIKLQQEYGSDLQVLFVECQGADLATAEAFAWRQGWMGTAAMWTTERPLNPEGSGLPAFALLDTEGKVLLTGNPLDKKKQIEEAIAGQVKKAKNAPAGTLPVFDKAWATFVKGQVAAAMEECGKLGTDVLLAEPSCALRAEMTARTEARIARGQWLLDNGYLGEAGELLTPLGKSVKGCPELEQKIAPQLARLAPGKDAGASEAEAAKALASLQQKMLKDKPFEDANLKALDKLAQKYKGTKAAGRAAHLVEIAKLKVL